MTDPFTSLFGMAGPPVSVPLRILGMTPDHSPSHDHIKSVFRTKN